MLKSVLCQRVKCYKSSVRQLTSEDQTEREKIPTQSGKLAWSGPKDQPGVILQVGLDPKINKIKRTFFCQFMV